MSSTVEIKFQVQCRGVMLIRFDYIVGPLVEKIFPHGIIPEELLWNLALDVWMSMGTKSMEEGYSTTVFLKDINMFACLVSGGSGGGTPYVMAALFNPEGMGSFWSVRDKVAGALLEHIKRIRRGEDVEKVVTEAYDAVVKTTLGPVNVGISSTFLHDTAKFVAKLVFHVQSTGKWDNELREMLRSYVERLADEASKTSNNEVLRELVKLKPFL
ncbi:MAG: hypothetical protein QXX87_04080 [Candidatus Jordarchaeales archaeon]